MSAAVAAASRAVAFDEPAVLVIREYLRVSVDGSGVEKSNDQQHAENVAAVDATRGQWVLSDLPPYRDVGSAGPRSKKVRLDFAVLVDDIRAGNFRADALMIWESSRGSRRVSEWCSLLELCEERGVLVIVTTHGPRLYDPANDRDWRSLMEDAVDSEYESRKTSRRVGRDQAAAAAAGAAHGGRRAFGYRAGAIVPDEADAIRDAARRVLGGESIRSITADWNRRGIRTPGTVANPAGNAWHPGSVAAVLRSPRLAGLRTHRGHVVAVGRWPAILDEVTHRRLVAKLARAPRGPRGPAPHLLTGVLRCEWCGAGLVCNADRNGVRRYECRTGLTYRGCGRLGIKADPVEEVIGVLVTERLAAVAARRAAGGDEDDEPEIAELDRLADLRRELSEARVAGTVSKATAEADAEALDRAVAAVEARLAAKMRTTGPLDFVTAEGYVGRPWSTLTVDERRVVLGAVLDHVTVGPAEVRGLKHFEVGRVVGPGRIVWRA